MLRRVCSTVTHLTDLLSITAWHLQVRASWRGAGDGVLADDVSNPFSTDPGRRQGNAAEVRGPNIQCGFQGHPIQHRGSQHVLGECCSVVLD